MNPYKIFFILYYFNLHHSIEAFQISSIAKASSSEKSINLNEGSFVQYEAQTRRSTLILSSSSSSSAIEFFSPLLSDGYLPAVKSFESGERKPILMYLPGFDGTLIAPFLQFPELGTIFDIRGMKVAMSDRSKFEDLKNEVIQYLLQISSKSKDNDGNGSVAIYLMGESFGGILASSVSHTIQKDPIMNKSINLSGLILVNPATSFLRSRLAELGPPVSKLPSFVYPLGVLFKLVPLFVDQYQLPQLLLILSSKALPSVIDSPEREAYMGRVALSLPQRLQFMPQDTLKWRLEQWLTNGCLSLGENSEKEEEDCQKLSLLSEKIRTFIIVGEDDLTLPSVDEALRLTKLIPNSNMFVVKGAGHASTCGSRVDLAALMRGQFEELQDGKSRTEMKEDSKKGEGELFGMEPRYDGNTNIGMLPTRYWDKDLYKQVIK